MWSQFSSGQWPVPLSFSHCSPPGEIWHGASGGGRLSGQPLLIELNARCKLVYSNLVQLYNRVSGTVCLGNGGEVAVCLKV